MRIIYRGVDFGVVKTHEFNIEAVYDYTMTDYLYSRVTFVGEGLVNGQAEVVLGAAGNGPFVSYDLGAPLVATTIGSGGTGGLGGGAALNPTRDGTRVVPRDGSLNPPLGQGVQVGPSVTQMANIIRRPNDPPLTHKAIRHRLMDPQGQLYIFSGPGQEAGFLPDLPSGLTTPPTAGGTLADIIVASPDTGRVCDCKNGPIPREFKILDSFDDNTFTFLYAIETYINESPENGSNPNGALISNRYSQSETVDRDGYTSITTDGVALFRTDLVYGGGAGAVFAPPQSPDAGRAVLFMPIPQGFDRVIDFVKALPDVTGVHYAYTDIQRKTNFVAGPYSQAADITILHRQAITSDNDVLGGALAAYERILSIKANRKFGKPDAVPPSEAPAGTGGEKRGGGRR